MLIDEGYQNNRFAADALSTLHSVVHIDRLINYYAVRRANMDEALNVFVRVNSGGEPLSLSDMLMSTMIANWKTDARKKIFGLVDEIRAKGFFINKDLILKTCLYLYSSDIRYKASNFSNAQVKPFEDNWDGIHASILAVFDLVRGFGYNESSLTSKNALLPIVYWVHHRQLADGIVSRIGLRAERDKIRKWLHLMLLKGVFGGAADTVLSAIRKAFVGDDFGKLYLKVELESFPSEAIAEILRAQGKDPQVTDEFIDTLLYTQYEDRSAFTLLALLAPNLDYNNGDFHKDHLHPASAFKRSKLLAAKITDADFGFYQDNRHWNSILNLRHLDSAENKSKQDAPLIDWAVAEAKRQSITVEKFCLDRQLPNDPALLGFPKFREFIAERRKIVGAQLRDILG
jgi:hypothetical protein